jgi:glycosyltransferase involved in cell wall biosynthesis
VNAPLFSVATPARNAFANLRRCVGSVRGQAPIPVQHLLQDACSTDGSVQWMAQQQDLSIVSEPDQGMYDAIDRAWARSTGCYLSWLNADEQYLPGTLSIVHQYFEAHPKTDVLFGDYIVCQADGSPVAWRREIPYRRTYVLNGFLYLQSCTLFFRRRLFERRMMKFDTTLRYAADKDLILRLDAAGVRIDHLAQPLAIFGIDGNNLSAHEGMTREAEVVRQRHGASRLQLWRQLVLGGRRLERWWQGGYARRDFEYVWACDEVPHYRAVSAAAVGGRYSLSDART